MEILGSSAFFLLLAGVSQWANAGDLEISNVRLGLIKFDKSGHAFIYKDGSEFPYRGSDVCVREGFKFPCQKYAIEFNFRALREEEILQCTTTSSFPVSHVSGRETREVDASSFNWNMRLPKGAGRYKNTQFASIDNGRPLMLVSNCSSKGHKVLAWHISFTP